jgi:hypothetical protein
MLDYSMRGPLTPGFFVRLAEEVPSSMVPEPRSWVQFSPTTQFSATRIPLSLAFVEPTGMATPEQEQVAPTVTARTQEGEYWTIV